MHLARLDPMHLDNQTKASNPGDPQSPDRFKPPLTSPLQNPPPPNPTFVTSFLHETSPPPQDPDLPHHRLTTAYKPLFSFHLISKTPHSSKQLHYKTSFHKAQPHTKPLLYTFLPTLPQCPPPPTTPQRNKPSTPSPSSPTRTQSSPPSAPSPTAARRRQTQTRTSTTTRTTTASRRRATTTCRLLRRHTPQTRVLSCRMRR
ncbi:hypothetical protein BJ508DRAFT_379348 [Ascobolus immersus RN42]|uniref:Uncharacterized protein n=1 Tax=Ascobolus immersus RN42 TaxID=1160509 RepID=A0A3N4HS49_ASCIM|nr:hypothetical protein BJ508DRAFT_379348 [Ascobolus immersus RN42]